MMHGATNSGRQALGARTLCRRHCIEGRNGHFCRPLLRQKFDKQISLYSIVTQLFASVSKS